MSNVIELAYNTRDYHAAVTLNLIKQDKELSRLFRRRVEEGAFENPMSVTHTEVMKILAIPAEKLVELILKADHSKFGESRVIIMLEIVDTCYEKPEDVNSLYSVLLARHLYAGNSRQLARKLDTRL